MHQELTQYLGGQQPILNKIGLIIKEKNGKVHKRMILDTKQSKLKECSAKHQRVLLPRLLDAITQALNLMNDCKEDEGMDWMVLDFSDAFWQVPLDPAERRYFCARVIINGVAKFVVFLRTVQGSRSAPLSWARVAAILMRMTQSIVGSSSARLHCFVDDPIASIKGTRRARRITMTTMVLIWEAMGFQLSYRKGQTGQAVDWIGGHLEFTTEGVRARVKQSIVTDIVTALADFEGRTYPAKRCAPLWGAAIMLLVSC